MFVEGDISEQVGKCLEDGTLTVATYSCDAPTPSTLGLLHIIENIKSSRYPEEPSKKKQSAPFQKRWQSSSLSPSLSLIIIIIIIIIITFSCKLERSSLLCWEVIEATTALSEPNKIEPYHTSCPQSKESRSSSSIFSMI